MGEKICVLIWIEINWLLLLLLTLRQKSIALAHLPSHEEKMLLQQLKDGSEAALTLLYKAHWQSLFLTAFNVLKDKKACEDIVQDIFLQLWLRRETLMVRDSLATYLSAAVRYQVFNHLRKACKTVTRQQLPHNTSLAANSDDRLLAHDLYTRIHKAVKTLPEKCRQVYCLSRDEQLTHKQIAAQLNISVKTVENQLTIALRRLRHHL